MLLLYLIRQTDRRNEQATREIKQRKRRRDECGASIYTIGLALLIISRIRKINDGSDYKRL